MSRMLRRLGKKHRWRPEAVSADVGAVDNFCKENSVMLLRAVEDAFKVLSDSTALAVPHTPQSLIKWKPSMIAAVAAEAHPPDVEDTFTWLEEVAQHIPIIYRGRIADIMADITLAVCDPSNHCSPRVREVWAGKLVDKSYLLIMRICPRDPSAYPNVTSARKLIQAVETTAICPAYVVTNLSKHLDSVPRSAPVTQSSATATSGPGFAEKRSISRRKSIKEGPSTSESVRMMFGMTEKEGEAVMERERAFQKKRRLEHGVTGGQSSFLDEFEYIWSKIRRCQDFFDIGLGEADPL